MVSLTTFYMSNLYIFRVNDVSVLSKNLHCQKDIHQYFLFKFRSSALDIQFPNLSRMCLFCT